MTHISPLRRSHSRGLLPLVFQHVTTLGVLMLIALAGCSTKTKSTTKKEKVEVTIDPLLSELERNGDDLTKALKRMHVVLTERDGKILGLDFTNRSLTDAGLKRVGELKDLRTLHLNFTRITDTGLETVGKLPQLESLSLGHTKITDKGLAHLKNLKNLKAVSFLRCSEITDAGIEHLSGNRNLQSVILIGTKCTNRSLRLIGQFLNLKEISVQGPNFTDEGLMHLKKCKELKKLSMVTTGVTNRGISVLSEFSNLQHLDLHFLKTDSL